MSAERSGSGAGRNQRPILEYCTGLETDLKKDLDLLEKVQKRATRMMITEKGLTYEERLKIAGYHNTGDEKTLWRIKF